MSTDPSLDVPAGVGLTDPTLALGLNGLGDGTPQMPFLDLMKQARLWKADMPGDDLEYDALVAGGYLDEHGWPTSMPDGASNIQTLWDFPPGTPGAEGPWVLTYTGTGILNINWANVTSSEPGRIEFTNPNADLFWMSIEATDPNHTGDYIRDIRIVPAKYEALADTGEIFNPEFLAVVDDARQLRFMDWMHTNNSPQSDWQDRPQVDDFSWNQGGVPLEIMVALANKVGADPWLNIPHMATDEYVENFAAYVRDNLDPGLVANVEYSNETWNFNFGQYVWLAAQAQAEWGVTGGDAWIQYSAKRATEVAMIWDEVFGSQADARVYNVIGLQAGWQGLAETQVNANLWQTKDPDGFVAPSSVFDALAVTTYFGGQHVSNETLRNELLAQINAHPNDLETVYDWLTDRLLTRTDIEWTVPYIEGNWAWFRNLADSLGLDMVAYEGGNHEHHSAFTSMSAQDIAKFTAFYTGYSYSPQIAKVYEALYQAWAEVSDGPFMQFTDVGTPNQYGSFPMLRSLTDSNARADMLNALNATVPSWFGDGGGSQYQQGVIKLASKGTGETLTGTNKDDVLVGGDGNDIFIPGLGSDRLNGGKGNDTYHLGESSPFILDASGWDTITSTISRSLNDYTDIENLTLLGSANINGTGNAWSNTIIGNDGDNILDGGAGADTLQGGLGNDTYVLAGATNDILIELENGGIDTITSTITRDLRNYANVENLTLLMSAHVDATGNELNNVLVGNSGKNTLRGLGGNDVLWGGAGNDTLDGGEGDDELNGGLGNDTYVLADGYDLVIDEGGWDTITSTISRNLNDYPDIENLTLLGSANINATGNAWSNTLIGNGGDNILDGGPGADTLQGGLGNDTYVLAGATNDTIYDIGGIDTITSTITRDLRNYNGIENLTLTFSAYVDGYGNGFANVLTGNSGKNSLWGLAGDDVLFGMGGDDTLYGGDGNDILDGGDGLDALYGGLGNDTYVLGDGNDTVVDDGGWDLITSTISRDLGNYAQIENLTLLGTANINATGNAWSNTLTGNSGDNVLDGGAGADTLIGGLGNDTYIITSATNDTIIELAGGGNDTIVSTISRNLSNFANIENITLTNSAHVDATGDATANRLTGNAGNNILRGLAGNDTLDGGNGNDTLIGGTGTDVLIGGAGRDVFGFETLADSVVGAGRDVILDFVTGQDTIDLSAIAPNGQFLAANAAEFTNTAYELRWFQMDVAGTENDQTVVELDANGDGIADFQIALSGLHDLTRNDFLL